MESFQKNSVAFLDKVRPENYFVLKNGFLIRSLPELYTILKEVDSEIFNYHVGQGRNDFANWIEHTIGDNSLKNTIQDVTNKEVFVRLLNSRINEIKSNSLETGNHYAEFFNFLDSQHHNQPNIQFDVPYEGELLDMSNILTNEALPEKLSMQVAAEEELPIDLPPDVPPEVTEPQKEEKPKEEEKLKPQEQGLVQEPPQEVSQESKQESKPVEIEMSVEEAKEEKKAEEQKEPELEKKMNGNSKEDMVEIREIELAPLGIKELDKLFKHGVPKICNMLFVGVMSSGKTLTALKLILSTAKKGEKAIYISLHDSEEKIINIMKSMDKDILTYVNSGNILIKKLDTFEIARLCHFKKEELEKKQEAAMNCNFTLEFVEKFNPSVVVVDSLSTLELTFSDDKMCYRHYISNMFKYFEDVGVRSVMIKELVKEEDLHIEFFENILADSILYFAHKKDGGVEIKLIKDYPVSANNKKKEFFSFLKKERR